MKTRLSVSLVLLILVAPCVAAAEPHSNAQPVAERVVTTTRWYGWQTLLVDGGVLGVALATRSPYVFLGGYTLGAPIVHWAHGNVLKGFGSLGLRVAAPLLVGLAYSARTQPEPATGHEREETMSVAILAGGIAAIAFDAAFLARSQEARVAPPPRSAWQVEPRLSASHRGASAGIGGTF